MDPGRSYMDNLEVAVLDESRIVTYRWLSTFLSSPVNEAKKMLYRFAKERKEVEALYLVSGVCKATSTYTVALAPEASLEETKGRMQPLFSVHVYSVQKKLPANVDLVSKDFREQQVAQYPGLRADPSKLLDSASLGPIRCLAATRRSLEPLRAKKETKKETKKEVKTAVKEVKKTVKRANTPPVVKAEAAPSQLRTTSSAPAASGKKPAKDFFGRQKAAASKDKEKAKDTKKAAEAAVAKRKPSIFDAVGSKRSREEKDVKEEKKKDVEKKSSVAASTTSSSSTQTSQPPRKRLKTKAASKEAEEEDDSIFGDDEDDMPKRVAVVTDEEEVASPMLESSEEEVEMADESQEEEEEEESQEVLPTPPKETALDRFVKKAPAKPLGPEKVVAVHSTPGASATRRKVTRRKLVDGYYQFVDEWEDADDSEKEKSKKEVAEAQTKKKEARKKATAKLSKATNQKSLASFFKKK